MKKLETRWSKEVLENPEQILQEYPRPQMRRDSYVNLNGYWDYAITESKSKPDQYDGQILVPFSPEASLSGVNRQLLPKEYLWYHRELPAEVAPSKDSRWLLHFGAVDQVAVVYVNGQTAGKHMGGYLPFSIDISTFLKSGQNHLTVAVRDVTDESYYSRGKQKLKRGGMFYTAQSGIWQTVWMEQVPTNYIENIQITPNYDKRTVSVLVTVPKDCDIECTVNVNEHQRFKIHGHTNQELRIPLTEFHPWSPEEPYLYPLEIQMDEDCIYSYFAMRKISMELDSAGIPRPYLNNQPYFQRGVLDQGYWPDGLYTAPCDAALIFDVQKMKDLGFNMLRKHIKIEPDRWYYHCDRLGMLVWQDMVCGGGAFKSWYVTYLATAMHRLRIHPTDRVYHLLGSSNKKGRQQFEDEMKETIERLYNHPSIVTWVIFNEGWGQFDAKKMTEIARAFDHTRLLDQASGWFDQKGGDYRSIHEYFFSLNVKPEERIIALTEYGGYSWHIDEHSMCDNVYGYRIYKNKQDLSKGYEELHEKQILPNIKKGLSVTTYTQVSDIEEEVNGFYTYDREVLKMDGDIVRKCNEKLIST